MEIDVTPDDLLARPHPTGLDPALTALWHAAHNEWDRAHEAAQAGASQGADWVHAYLHRVEGDLDNARYWYGRAGRPVHTGPLDVEWAEIARGL